MFDDCYLRLGRGPFASCTPLTVQLLAALYALPARMSLTCAARWKTPGRQAVERQPCRRARADRAGGQQRCCVR
jgi:hypothetical protein